MTRDCSLSNGIVKLRVMLLQLQQFIYNIFICVLNPLLRGVSFNTLFISVIKILFLLQTSVF